MYELNGVGAWVTATNVGKKGHFKEKVTLGLLSKDEEKFEEVVGRAGEGRRGRRKTNTKKGSWM